jgi:hypothetical protein
VLVEVVSVSSREGHASIFFAFSDRPHQTPDGQNPYLEPMKSQGRYAEELLDLVAHVVENDVAYSERLVRHYHEVKQFMVDHPDHHLHRSVAADRQVMQAVAHRIVEGMRPPALPPRVRDRDKERRKRKQQRRSRKRNR